MRINEKVIEALAKGFSAQLSHINLDYNALEKEGVSKLNKQL